MHFSIFQNSSKKTIFDPPPAPPLPPYQRLIKWGGVRAKDKYLVAPLRRPPPGGGVFGGGPKTPIFGVFGGGWGFWGGREGLDEWMSSKMEKSTTIRSRMLTTPCKRTTTLQTRKYATMKQKYNE